MLTRTLTLGTAAAAALSLTACEDAALPVTQVIDGPTVRYVVQPGELSAEAFTLDTTFATADLQARLEALGIDNFLVNSVEIDAVDLAIVNAAGVEVGSRNFVSINDVERFALSVGDEDVDAGRTRNLLRLAEFFAADFPAGTYTPASVQASLQTFAGINLVELLRGERLRAVGEVKLRRAIEIEAPVTIELDIRYKVEVEIEAAAEPQL